MFKNFRNNSKYITIENDTVEITKNNKTENYYGENKKKRRKEHNIFNQ